MKLKRRRTAESKNTLLIIIIASALVIFSVCYMLADRYLIEHVEAKVQDTGSGSNISQNNVNASTDDWNYKSSSISVHIDKVETGSGKDKVTYFVADVKLSNNTNLLSAFAKNEFGRNIVETTSKIASDNNAIFAINGDYYGFRNDGVIIRNGVLYRDVPVREAAAFYKNGTMKTFDETQVTQQTLLKDGVQNTLSFGPVLVKDGKAAGDFSKVAVDTNFGNRSIEELNPRTGVGMIEPNHFIFIVVDGRMDNYSKGMTLSDFAKLFADYGCIEAYNLDGGGSATMYFEGRVVNNPLGRQRERAVSDILYVKEK